MAAAVIRNMPIGQNMHMSQNNYVMGGPNAMNANGLLHHQTQLHHHHMQQTLLQQQQHQLQQLQQPQTHIQQHSPVAAPAPVTTIHAHHIQQQQPHHPIAPAKRPIAPAPANLNRSTVISAMDHHQAGIRSVVAAAAVANSKKNAARMNFMPYGAQPASVQRRNARERNRVKQVNNGFANLRQHIPNEIITALTHGGRGASKKLSKVDTLRLAVEYIRQLQDLLDDSDAEASSSTSSQQSVEPYYTNTSIPPPPCSESSASPTPSYSSENSSSISNNYMATPLTYCKNETFEYNAEDEELLDCIAWWQQQ